jgi:hypothetical protein
MPKGQAARAVLSEGDADYQKVSTFLPSALHSVVSGRQHARLTPRGCDLPFQITNHLFWFLASQLHSRQEASSCIIAKKNTGHPQQLLVWQTSKAENSTQQKVSPASKKGINTKLMQMNNTYST